MAMGNLPIKYHKLVGFNGKSSRNGGCFIAMFNDQTANTQCLEAQGLRQNVAVKSSVQPIFLPDFVAG